MPRLSDLAIPQFGREPAPGRLRGFARKPSAVSARHLAALRRELPDLPVIVRLSGNDFFPGGLVPEEGLRLARWVAEAGAAAVHVSAGHYRSLPSTERMIPPMAYPEGCFLPYAARIRSETAVPVLAVGRLGDPALAEAALAEGKADFIALGRPLIADPSWVHKVASGAIPRRCIACNSCVNQMRGASIHWDRVR